MHPALFISGSKRSIILLLVMIGLLILAAPLYSVRELTPVIGVQPLAGKVIAIDPGHGGYDPGVFVGDVLEKEIVLQVSLKLRDYLRLGGAAAIMTREKDMDFLSEPQAGPKKREDMNNRMQIVTNSGAELLISVHANSFPSSFWSGAQTFYYPEYEQGEILAALIQEELRQVLKNTDRWHQGGDYFMLREADIPAVIVEVGFISNPEERDLIQQEDYQQRIAWAIYRGIVRYYNGETPLAAPALAAYN